MATPNHLPPVRFVEDIEEKAARHAAATELITERMDLLTEQTGLRTQEATGDPRTILWRMAGDFAGGVITARAFCQAASIEYFKQTNRNGSQDTDAVRNLDTLADEVGEIAGVPPETLDAIWEKSVLDVK